MSNSSLVSYTKISTNKTSPRTKKITRITIHCFVGQVTVERGCEVFADPNRKASCNYVVAKDGKVGLVVEEKDRSWCSSSSDNDHRAITIEVASDTSSPYAITDKAYNSLIRLVTDICDRNGIKKTIWIDDKEKALSYALNDGECLFTVHKWFANKACPGPYILSKMQTISDKVNANINPNTTKSFLVRVTTDALNIRTKPSIITGRVVGVIEDKGVYTIVETSGSWGKLKSGIGWISLNYCKRL